MILVNFLLPGTTLLKVGRNISLIAEIQKYVFNKLFILIMQNILANFIQSLIKDFMF